MNIILYFIVLTTIASFMAAMEKVAFHYEKSIFPQSGKWRDFFDVLTSYDNKYKNGDSTQGEAFPFSTTVLVMFTDFWHLSKFIWLVLFIIISHIDVEISSNILNISKNWNTVTDVTLIYTYIGIIHNFMFHVILNKKN